MATALKDIYSNVYISKLAKHLANEFSNFQEDKFLQRIFNEGWSELSLKERMRHVTVSMHDFLPKDYEQVIKVLQKIAPDFSDNALASIIFPDYVEVYGLNDWEVSMKALECFTQYSTSEFAVRPFFLQNPNLLINQMFIWSKHPNHHIRRLASEGIRPRLPWGIGLKTLKKNPGPIIPILENLKEDGSLYVRKSVANNMNDISKDHPDLVIQLAKQWKGKHPHTDWILKHGCRGLLRKGNKEALSIFGFQSADSIKVETLSIKNSDLKIGDSLEFAFKIKGENVNPQTLRVEYAIDFVKARGSRNKKIFYIKEAKLPIQGKLIFQKTHSLQDLTTRKHYPGLHTLSIIVNGESKNSINFEIY